MVRTCREIRRRTTSQNSLEGKQVWSCGSSPGHYHQSLSQECPDLTYDERLAGGEEVLEVLHADHHVGILPDGLVKSSEDCRHRRPVGGHINPLVLVDLGESFVQPSEEVDQDRLHGDLGPVRVGEDVRDVGRQAGAGHRVPVIRGQLDEGGRHLVELDQTFLIKQLHSLLLGRLLKRLW